MNNTLINKNITDVSHSLRKIKVEEEGYFPDYCSDIVRVVKVEANPVITDIKTRVQDSGMLLEASGRVDFNVIYTGEEGHCECYGFSCSFAESFKSPLASGIEEDNVSCTVIPTIENTVCKVQSPRKVTVRCDIVLDVAIKGNCLFECINAESYEKEGRSEIMKRKCKLASLVGSLSDNFDFSEEIKLPSSSHPMERILSCNASVSLDNTSVTSNALNFWGTLGIYCVYLPEVDGEQRVSPESFYQPIEISGRMETDFSESDLWATGTLIPAGISFEIIPDNFGENRILKINGSYMAQFDLVTNNDVELTKDIYGVGCDLEVNEDERNLVKFVGSLKESTALREVIDLREGVERVEGCRGEIKLVSRGSENGKLFADYRLDVSAVGSGENGENGIKESINLHIPLNLPSEISNPDKLYPVISASVGYIDCKVMGNKAELNFDVTTTAHVFEEERESYVSAVSLKEREGERDCQIFCYPSWEDSLWSIGKRYGVSIKDLKSKNAISNDEVKRVMKI